MYARRWNKLETRVIQNNAFFFPDRIFPENEKGLVGHGVKYRPFQASKRYSCQEITVLYQSCSRTSSSLEMHLPNREVEETSGQRTGTRVSRDQPPSSLITFQQEQSAVAFLITVVIHHITSRKPALTETDQTNNHFLWQPNTLFLSATLVCSVDSPE